jgi:hypothetical protein
MFYAMEILNISYWIDNNVFLFQNDWTKPSFFATVDVELL